MSRYSGSDEYQEHQPITWLNGHAIYAAHLIVVVYVTSMIVTAVLGMGSPLLAWLPFTSFEVRHGEVWRIFTYGLVNPPGIQFVLDMIMFVWFGREVEKFYGRRKFLFLYANIYLLPPLLLTVLGAWIPGQMMGEFGALAVFVAFATLYPRVPLMFNVLAQWAAIILVGIYSMMALAGRNWSWLIAIWAANGFAHGFVRYQQDRLTLPRLRLWKRTPNLRVLPDLPGKKGAIEITATPVKALKDDSMAEIDALLDKIAQSGISSLTAKERARLEKGREKILKRESGRR